MEETNPSEDGIVPTSDIFIISRKGCKKSSVSFSDSPKSVCNFLCVLGSWILVTGVDLSNHYQIRMQKYSIPTKKVPVLLLNSPNYPHP